MLSIHQSKYNTCFLLLIIRIHSDSIKKEEAEIQMKCSCCEPVEQNSELK